VDELAALAGDLWFGCTAHASRGAAICSYSLSTSQRKTSRTLVNALKEKLHQPKLIERFVAKSNQTTSRRNAKGASKKHDLERRVHDSERRVANLTESLAKVGWSDAVAAKLRVERARAWPAQV
jgi:hypothetical protein